MENNKLWCIGICPEDDSPHEQSEGTAEEHQEQMFYTEDWFKEPMYQCKNMQQAEQAFKYGEIVHCYKDSAELITSDFDEAKRFYEVA